MDDGWFFNKSTQEWWYWRNEEITFRVALEAWAAYRYQALLDLMKNK